MDRRSYERQRVERSALLGTRRGSSVPFRSLALATTHGGRRLAHARRYRVARPKHFVCYRGAAVAISSADRNRSASSRFAPHISRVGRKLAHTAGRSGFPNNAHCKSGVSCTQGIPAGLPCGMPGIGEEIEGAMQQAAQPERQFMAAE